MKSQIQTLTNPLKHTDPTGYQTAPAPGAISRLGGGGGMGESNGFSWSGFSHYAKNVFTDPSYYYYDAEGNYHHGFYFGGDEIVSYDEVFDNYVSKRGTDVTYLVKQTGTSFTAKGIDIPFIYNDSWSSNGFGIGVLNVGWLSVVDNAASSSGGDGWAVTAAQASLSFMAADAMVLDPSDAAVYKWVGYVIAATVAGAVLYFNGTSNYPGPWYTDRPKNYIPAPLNGPNNRNYFPQGNGNDFIKWTIRLGGASALGKKLYDGFNLQPDFMPADNTNFVNPTPSPMPPFYTPIPNLNKP